MDNSNNMTTSSSPTPGAPRQRKIHPLVATAAGAVIIASLAATAVVTGLFPKASSTSPTNDQAQAAQQAAQQQQPAPQVAQAQLRAASSRPTRLLDLRYGGSNLGCAAEGQGTGIGAVGGAVAGGLIGNQFGREAVVPV